MKIYVGNIPYKLTAQDLRELFSPFGEVISSNIITDKQTSRSKGFGFVELSSKAEADTAIREMDGKEIQKRQLKVSLAKEKNEQQPRRERIFL